MVRTHYMQTMPAMGCWPLCFFVLWILTVPAATQNPGRMCVSCANYMAGAECTKLNHNLEIVPGPHGPPEECDGTAPFTCFVLYRNQIAIEKGCSCQKGLPDSCTTTKPGCKKYKDGDESCRCDKPMCNTGNFSSKNPPWVHGPCNRCQNIRTDLKLTTATLISFLLQYLL